MILLFLGTVLSIFGPTMVLVLAGVADTRVSTVTSAQTLTFLLLMVFPAVGGVVFGTLIAKGFTGFSSSGGSGLSPQ